MYTSSKIFFRKICDIKIPWDKELLLEIKKTWLKWEKVLPSYFDIPRPMTSVQEKHRGIELHLFEDGSMIGTSAVAYDFN